MKKYIFIFLFFSFFPLQSSEQTASLDSIKHWLSTWSELDLTGLLQARDTLLLTQVLEQQDQVEYQAEVMQAKLYLGGYYILNDEYLEALTHLLGGVEIAEKVEDKQMKYRLKNKIGTCLMRLGRLNKAVNTYLEILSNLDPGGDSYYYYKSMYSVNLAITYLYQNKVEEAIKIFQDISPLLNNEAYAKDEEYQKAKSLLFTNLGFTYLIKNKPYGALPLLNNYHKYIQKKQNNKGLAKSYGNLAYCHYLMQDFSQAYTFYEQSLTLSIQHGYQQVTLVTYKDLSDTYLANKKYELGIEYLNKHYQLKDSLQGEAVQDQLNALEIAHANTLQEQEILRLEQAHEIKQQRLQSGISIVSLVAIMLVGFLVAQFRKRKTQAELQFLKLANMNKELEYQKQDITKLALEISKKHDFSKSILEQLQYFKRYISTEAKKEWFLFENNIQNYLLSNEEQQIFHENVEQVNEAFFGKLIKDFPNLSKGDRELCSYIRLGLSNKEISVLRGISPEAIRTRRYRLRKKLNLEVKEDVELFLQEI